MHTLTDEMERAVRRATELTAELADVLRSLRPPAGQAVHQAGHHAGADRPAELIDEAVLEQLANDLGGTEEVTSLVTSYANGLDSRGRDYLASCERFDDVGAQRLFRDLRSASELVGATAIVEWCGRRTRGEIAIESELLTLIEQTRRAMTLWRLSLP